MKRPPIAQHYEQLLGLGPPWQVVSVELVPTEQTVRVEVAHSGRPKPRCPRCDAICSRYDSLRREWRHLDTMQYQTILAAKVPRVQCNEHGVHQLEVPWAEPHGRFTALFEIVVIDWLKQASTAAVADLMGLSWSAVSSIRRRAVRRGLARRRTPSPRRICVDETSGTRRRQYVTVVSDADAGTVLYVGEERRATSLAGFYEELGDSGCLGIESVSLDMWDPYIKATKQYVPNAAEKISFDKYHIAKIVNEGVDTVRRREARELRARADMRLNGTRHLWLYNLKNMTAEQRARFESLRTSSLKSSEAWAMKAVAMQLWDYHDNGWAAHAWKRWMAWVNASALEPMKRVARTIGRYFYGVINAATSGITNARAESMNSKIQGVKRRCRGFRNPRSLREAILFHYGGLELYPRWQISTHTNR